MNIYCPKGLHPLFQALDGNICEHTFFVSGWDTETRPLPNNVKIMTKNQLEDPEPDFYGAILVQSYEDYINHAKNIDKTIIYYDLMNGRGNFFPQDVYANKNVIACFVSCSCRISHGVYDQIPHKCIMPGVDDEFFSGFDIKNAEKKIVHVRNSFKERDILKFNDFEYICDDIPYTLIGRGGHIVCNYKQLREQFLRHRVCVNPEIFTSTCSISSMEYATCGGILIGNDVEGSGEFIINGYNGYISNNLNYLRKRVKDVMNDDELAVFLSKNARESAKIKFGKLQFNLNWNDFLNNLDFYKRK